MTFLPKRVTDKGLVDDLNTTELLALYSIEYTLGDNPMESFGVAMITLLSCLPQDRLWSLPLVYQKDNMGVIHIEGLKKKVYEETKV